MRVLFCGSRNWTDQVAIISQLNDLPADTVIIHGGARGADEMAGKMAEDILGMEVEVYEADWERYGRAAGPIRNKRMLDEGKPDLVIAFMKPESKGTKNMVEIAEKAGVPVQVINDLADDWMP